MPAGIFLHLRMGLQQQHLVNELGDLALDITCIAPCRSYLVHGGSNSCCAAVLETEDTVNLSRPCQPSFLWVAELSEMAKPHGHRHERNQECQVDAANLGTAGLTSHLDMAELSRYTDIAKLKTKVQKFLAQGEVFWWSVWTIS